MLRYSLFKDENDNRQFTHLLSILLLISLISLICIPTVDALIPPKNLGFSVGADPTQISPGSYSSIIVTVVDLDNNYKPVQNVYIVLDGEGGTLSLDSGYTDSNGQFRTTFTTTKGGSYLVVVKDFIPPIGYEKFSCPCGGINIEVYPIPIRIFISSNPIQIERNSFTSITVRVADVNGNPVENVNLILDGGGGTLNPSSGHTDSLGNFYTQFSAAIPGTYHVVVEDYIPPLGHVKYECPYLTYCGSTYITVLDIIPTTQPTLTPTIFLTETPTNPANIPPKAHFSVFPINGEEPLNVSYDAAGSSDSDGYVESWIWDFGDSQTGSGEQVSHVYQNPGVYTVTLLVKDNLAASSSASQQVSIALPTVTDTIMQTLTPTPTPPQPFNLPPMVAALAVVVLLAGCIGYVAWTRQNLNLKPEKKSVPCDGTSTIPIQIQFTNPFGRMQKQKIDREVEMITTSGTIQSVIIPAGRETVEAILTSSNEGGPVTVTAKCDNKIAEVQVKFECVEKELDVDISPLEIPADGVSTAAISVKIKNDKGRYITSLTERPVELRTTLGTIPGQIIIPPKSLSGTAILTAGITVGTAKVTATIGHLTGEKEIVFTDLAKRYCMHCGATMTIDAPKCPKCGNTPPSGVDTKLCGTCGAVLPVVAKFCDKCGARQTV